MNQNLGAFKILAQQAMKGIGETGHRQITNSRTSSYLDGTVQVRKKLRTQHKTILRSNDQR